MRVSYHSSALCRKLWGRKKKLALFWGRFGEISLCGKTGNREYGEEAAC
jgi:hypothetical protein